MIISSDIISPYQKYHHAQTAVGDLLQIQGLRVRSEKHGKKEKWPYEQESTYSRFTSSNNNQFGSLTHFHKMFVVYQYCFLSNWKLGEPNNAYLENCVEIWIERLINDEQWNDRTCEGANNFVCKRDPGSFCKEQTHLLTF